VLAVPIRCNLCVKISGSRWSTLLRSFYQENENDNISKNAFEIWKMILQQHFEIQITRTTRNAKTFTLDQIARSYETKFVAFALRQRARQRAKLQRYVTRQKLGLGATFNINWKTHFLALSFSYYNKYMFRYNDGYYESYIALLCF